MPRVRLRVRDSRISKTVTLVSLFFLFVYLFGAYTYGVATVYGLRETGPIWGRPRRDYAPEVRQRIDRSSLALFSRQ